MQPPPPPSWPLTLLGNCWGETISLPCPGELGPLASPLLPYGTQIRGHAIHGGLTGGHRVALDLAQEGGRGPGLSPAPLSPNSCHPRIKRSSWPRDRASLATFSEAGAHTGGPPDAWGSHRNGLVFSGVTEAPPLCPTAGCWAHPAEGHRALWGLSRA